MSYPNPDRYTNESLDNATDPEMVERVRDKRALKIALFGGAIIGLVVGRYTLEPDKQPVIYAPTEMVPVYEYTVGTCEISSVVVATVDYDTVQDALRELNPGLDQADIVAIELRTTVQTDISEHGNDNKVHKGDVLIVGDEDCPLK